MRPARTEGIQGTIICRRHDGYGEIVVAEEGNTRTLYFGNAIAQSAIRADRPGLLLEDYNEALMCSLLFNSSPRSILLVGLGGCSLVHFLLTALPDCALDVIELRGAVIDLAWEFFLLPRDKPNLRILQDDAAAFIISSRATAYDIIIVDAFDENGPASPLLGKDFLFSCRSRLSDKGIFVMNAWNSPDHNFSRLFDGIRHVFGGNALKLLLTESYRNAAVFGFKDRAACRDLTGFRTRAAELQNRYAINFPKYWKYLYWQNFNDQAQ